MIGRALAWFFGLAFRFLGALVQGVLRGLTGGGPPEEPPEEGQEDQKDTDTG